MSNQEAKRCIQTINNLTKNLVQSQDFVTNRLSIAKLREIQIRLDDLIAEYKMCREALCKLELIDPDNYDGDWRAINDPKYFEIRADLEDRIETLKENKNQIPRVNVCEGLSFVPKLPDLTIDKFTGDFKRWNVFIEAFDTHIHNNSKLNALTKYQYLKGLVVYPASKTFENLDFISANYEIARSLLIERYNRPKIIAEEHIHALFNAKPLEKPNPQQLLELLDDYNSHLRSLNTMGRPTNNWDDLIVYLIYSKFDPQTKSKWREECPQNDFATFTQISTFIKERSQKLNIHMFDQNIATTKHFNKSPSSNKSTSKTSLHTNKYVSNCALCNKSGHSIMRCYQFLSMPLEDRIKKVESLKLCSNCLNSFHSVDDCNSKDVCRTCQAKHHTLIHKSQARKDSLPKTSLQITGNTGESQPASYNSTTVSEDKNSQYVFLATALIEVVDKFNKRHIVRALLDSGSQLSFITTALASKLQLCSSKSRVQTEGVGGLSFKTSSSVMVRIFSRHNRYIANIECHTLPKITSHQPLLLFDIEKWAIPSNVKLADPTFNFPQKIDILIGADIYFDVQSVGQIRLGKDLPILQNTQLGWIVAGRTVVPQSFENIKTCHITTNRNEIDQENLEFLLKRFWTIENDSDIDGNSQQHSADQHFSDTMEKDGSGHFIVRLPFNHPCSELGDSEQIARRRFLSLERKLEKDKELYNSYIDFMNEYILLDHMQKTSEIQTPNYFLPHHCVVKPQSSSTKTRVVFDASAKTSNGVALNDILTVGPLVQNDLFTILLRFRSHRYAFSADIMKMYRQIKLHSDDQQFQYIFWRSNRSNELDVYKLKTVTYGMASSSFLATRCLVELANESYTEYPEASATIRNDIYVDDVLSGGNCLEDVRLLKRQVSIILQRAGMNLHKWCSNTPELLTDLPDSAVEKFIKFDNNDCIKTLGLYWQTEQDVFRININRNYSSNITKRSVISDIARIFDPFGFVAPVTVLGKVFMQKLWQDKLHWDEALTQNYHTFWLSFQNQLAALESLIIPRHLFNNCIEPSSVQLHGFADASSKAYGCVIYIRYSHENAFRSQIICSKSRVTPIKSPSIPRLELCAAQLLATTMCKVIEGLNFKVSDVIYWSDSTTTLYWIKSVAERWKPYITNRVRVIQNLTNKNKWFYVSTETNPADIVSRGLYPDALKNSTLWWNGPQFLLNNFSDWSKVTQIKLTVNEDIVEQESIKKLQVLIVTKKAENGFIQSLNFSNFLRIQNVLAWILRFCYNCRSSKVSRRVGRISSIEARQSEIKILQLMQIEMFADAYFGLLRSPSHTVSNPELKTLALFMGQDKLLRVGGRLNYSNLTYSTRHPILLHNKHFVTIALMNFIHRCHLHVGPQGLLAAARQKYWPLYGRSIAKQIYKKCVICVRARPQLFRQQMASLPVDRVNQSYPFMLVAVDYCGPFYLHYHVRGKNPTKTYLAVFVCQATKAIHLEVASDLSTAAFIGLLRRFIATRGLPSKILSDNATNFAGANNLLHELFIMLMSSKLEDGIKLMCQTDKIEWSFIPPNSPHFGGLHEAAVKSAKQHLRKMTMNAKLTFDEFYTLIKQVEATLNSRPLIAISSDDPIEILTPGHFLTGRPLTAIAEPFTPEDASKSILQRWDLVQNIFKHFWQRWNCEYLRSLQQRFFWNKPLSNVKVNTVVIIRDDNLPPLKWKLGRIVECHPGADGLVRVVSIRTSTGIIKRAITNIAPLPIEHDGVQGGEDDKATHYRDLLTSGQAL